jgi:hypothetical protein
MHAKSILTHHFSDNSVVSDRTPRRHVFLVCQRRLQKKSNEIIASKLRNTLTLRRTDDERAGAGRDNGVELIRFEARESTRGLRLGDGLNHVGIDKKYSETKEI